ncbi:MAG: PDZ domain-containing protein, partial [Planctomycetota bacterium]
VAKAAQVDALLEDDQQGTRHVYSDPPFRGPVASVGALVRDARGRAVGIVLQRAAPAPGGGRGMRMMRRPGGGLPLVKPAGEFAHFLGGEIGRRGVLGVTGETLGEKVAQALGVKGTQGVLVTQVTPGSGAAAAGIAAQEIILSVAGTPTPTRAALQQALQGKKAGETVAVEVLRITEEGAAKRALDVKLTAREASDRSDRFRARRFGFVAEPLTPTVRRDQGLAADVRGLHVRRVTRGSPAALARPTPLRRGDIILRVGDAPVPDMDALKKALQAVATGTAVTLFVRQGEDTRFVEITPEADDDR